jgi:hypothetical protein
MFVPAIKIEGTQSGSYRRVANRLIPGRGGDAWTSRFRAGRQTFEGAGHGKELHHAGTDQTVHSERRWSDGDLTAIQTLGTTVTGTFTDVNAAVSGS